MAKATPKVIETALENGCQLSDSGRLLFPPVLAEDMVAKATKQFTVHGRDPEFDFEAKNDRINFCTGGAAGTRKHIATSISLGEYGHRLLPLLDLLAGGPDECAKRPFCTVHATGMTTFFGHYSSITPYKC
ncbi:MAG: trimethylamine:corrinoid methyltransferase-like protein [Parasphingorhabdus sp.]|jgi:trimethylamine:corrinoid methyltransferase-like protein